MMDLALAIFVPLLLLAAIPSGMFVRGVLRKVFNKNIGKDDNFVVFEAEAINLPMIQSDLEDCGWQLVGSKATETGTSLYRFEKDGTASHCLSSVFDFDKSMPRTAFRTTGTNSLIKINSHGSKGSDKGRCRTKCACW